MQTDITKLVPQNLGSLQDLDELERVTGVGGEIDLMVSAPNLTKPATIEWMSAYQTAVLEALRLQRHARLRRARLCPAFSLPDLFQATPTAGASHARDAPRPAERPSSPRLT